MKTHILMKYSLDLKLPAYQYRAVLKSNHKETNQSTKPCLFYCLLETGVVCTGNCHKYITIPNNKSKPHQQNKNIFNCLSQNIFICNAILEYDHLHLSAHMT
jgi:hypothetical protein